MFGLWRDSCHFPLLRACCTANVDFLLPNLYYACTDYTIDGIFEDKLNPDCLRTLITGKFALDRALCKLVASLPDELHNISCQVCLVNARIVGSADWDLGSDIGDFDRCGVLDDAVHEVCPLCFKMLRERMEEKRKQIWKDVPSFFGFPGWDELQKTREELF